MTWPKVSLISSAQEKHNLVHKVDDMRTRDSSTEADCKWSKQRPTDPQFRNQVHLLRLVTACFFLTALKKMSIKASYIRTSIMKSH